MHLSLSLSLRLIAHANYKQMLSNKQNSLHPCWNFIFTAIISLKFDRIALRD